MNSVLSKSMCMIVKCSASWMKAVCVCVCVFIKVFELHACRMCVFVYRVQTLSLWHDERDYLQPLVHLNEVMSGEEGGALPLPSYTPLIRAGWGGQTPRPEPQPTPITH